MIKLTPRSPQGDDHPRASSMYYGALPELFEFAKKLRLNQTVAERKLWDKVRNKQLLGHKFRRQHPINRYIADFYCHKLKFVIELDGGYHLDRDQVKYDFNRDGEMEEFGILVKRIKNDQILSNLELTIASISKELTMRADRLLKEAGR